MPSTIKDRALYEQLRRHGASKQEAARRANQAAKRGRPSVGAAAGQGRGLDDLTVFDLKVRAKERGLQGYSDKSRAELIDMLHPNGEASHD